MLQATAAGAAGVGLAEPARASGGAARVELRLRGWAVRSGRACSRCRAGSGGRGRTVKRG